MPRSRRQPFGNVIALAMPNSLYGLTANCYQMNSVAAVHGIPLNDIRYAAFP